MNQARRQYINDLAERITEILSLGIPIDLKKLVEGLKGEILEKDTLQDSVEGMVTPQNSSNNNYYFKIEILKDKPEEHKRFTIAHEIGHLFLHMGYLIDDEKWKTSNARTHQINSIDLPTDEVEANEFAAALLMPKAKVYELANENIHIDQMAAFFKVTEPTLINRAIFLNTII